jgi:hypothetical protein
MPHHPLAGYISVRPRPRGSAVHPRRPLRGLRAPSRSQSRDASARRIAAAQYSRERMPVKKVARLLKMAHFKGQIVAPDFGFYGREVHMSLLRENRLIAGVNTLEELPPKLQQNIVLIHDRVPTGTTVEDAETLTRYARLVPQTNAFNDFVQDAVS